MSETLEKAPDHLRPKLCLNCHKIFTTSLELSRHRDNRYGRSCLKNPTTGKDEGWRDATVEDGAHVCTKCGRGISKSGGKYREYCGKCGRELTLELERERWEGIEMSSPKARAERRDKERIEKEEKLKRQYEQEAALKEIVELSELFDPAYELSDQEISPATHIDIVFRTGETARLLYGEFEMTMNIILAEGKIPARKFLCDVYGYTVKNAWNIIHALT